MACNMLAQNLKNIKNSALEGFFHIYPVSFVGSLFEAVLAVLPNSVFQLLHSDHKSEGPRVYYTLNHSYSGLTSTLSPLHMSFPHTAIKPKHHMGKRASPDVQ